MRILRTPEHDHSMMALTCLSAGGLTLALVLSGCTDQLPGSFRFLQQEESFRAEIEVNTKIDLLWVVDNSASMDAAQEKLRNGFDSFARQYLKPTWDVRLAVITTDTYLANPAFQDYLQRTIPGTTGWTSDYIASRLSTFQNPRANLVNLNTGGFDSGVRYGDLVPAWGPNFARLLPGLHDGPITGFCFEGLPYFLRGVTDCALRDVAGQNEGVESCLNPDVGAGESSLNQCLNTNQNDTVRSGRAVIQTLPPEGMAADESWIAQVVKDFKINATTGSVGHGSERGLSSVLQFLADNETSETAFFRPGSVRGIIFIADEDDQSIQIPSSPASDFTPWSGYRCDQQSLLSMNSASRISDSGSYCCDDGSCFLGAEGLTCASKTVDGYTFTPSVCAREDLLISVEEVKSDLDSFFKQLEDSGEVTDPGYFVASIVPLNAVSIQLLQTERSTQDQQVGAVRTHAVNRGDRYLELGELVGQGSLQMDLASEDYTPVLDQIGRTIIEKRGTFKLNREPTGSEDMTVTIQFSNGVQRELEEKDYSINGKLLSFTDLDLVLSLSSSDRIIINYQPKTVY